MNKKPIQLVYQKVLVLDDKEEVTNKIVGLLRSEGFESVNSLNYIDSFTSLIGYDLIISDIIWPTNKRGQIFSSVYVGLDIMEYVLGSLEMTKVILMSQSTYDLGKIKMILRAHGYFSLRDSDANILRVIHQVSLRSKMQRGENKKVEQTRFSQNVFHGPVIITETNQGVIMSPTTSTQGEIIDNLNIMEKMLLQAYDDKLIRVDEDFKREIQIEIAELRLEIQKKRPNKQRFQKLLDIVKKTSTGCLSILKFVNEFQQLIGKILSI